MPAWHKGTEIDFLATFTFMEKRQVTYPQYRKYAHGRTYFKIVSPNEFYELQVLGNTKTLHHFIAKILPDRNYIYDLLFEYHEHWQVIQEEEYINAAQGAVKAEKKAGL